MIKNSRELLSGPNPTTDSSTNQLARKPSGSKRLFLMSMLLLAILSIVPVGCNRCGSEEKLDATVKVLAGNFNSRNYGAVWELLSEELQRDNEFNQERYVGDLEDAGFRSRNTEVLKVGKNCDTAKVVVRVTYEDLSGQELSTNIEEWEFIVENGGWFFDGFKTLSEL